MKGKHDKSNYFNIESSFNDPFYVFLESIQTQFMILLLYNVVC